MYSRDVLTMVGEEQQCAFSSPLIFPVQRNKIGKALRSLFVGWKESRAEKCVVLFHLPPLTSCSVSAWKPVKIDFCCVSLCPLEMSKSNSTSTF